MHLGLGARVVGLVDGESPGDAGDLIGESDGGAVVSTALLEAKGPGLEAVGMFGAGGGDQSGPSAMDQERTQVGVATFGDGSQVSAGAAGVFSGDDAERAGEAAAGAETVQGTDEAGQGSGAERADAGDAEEARGVRRVASEGVEISIGIPDILLEGTDLGGQRQQRGMQLDGDGLLRV